MIVRQFQILLVALFVGLTSSGDPAVAESVNSMNFQTTLTVARVSGNPRKHIPALDALGHYLASHLGDLGIARHQLVLARDVAHLDELLRNGEADIVSETVFTALQLERSVGAELLLREWKSGVPTYHTVFFTRKDSGISALSDLVGRTIAFEDPGSTSAYFVPMLTLRREGLALFELETEETDPADNAVNYRFAHSETSIAAWVARGRVDAGVLSNLDWSDPERMPIPMKSELEIFYETPGVIRSLLLVRGDLSPALKEGVRNVLTTMHENEEGREVLSKYFKVARFDELTGQARQDLDHAKLLLAELE
ncbi:MAG: phosphate/phosphite/phosphonate ABC transporter substrate-binding protein [Alphaproteobacteria bacterium]